jgi:hypothetical protein
VDAHHVRGMRGELLNARPDAVRGDHERAGADECGSAARPLGVWAAEEVPQAAGPDLAHLAAVCVHDDVGPGAPAAQPAVLADRGGERARREPLALLAHRARRDAAVAMVDDRRQRPAGEYRRAA